MHRCGDCCSEQGNYGVLDSPGDQGKMRGPMSGVCRGSKWIAEAVRGGRPAACGVVFGLHLRASSVMAARTVCNEIFRSAGTVRAGSGARGCGCAHRVVAAPNGEAALATRRTHALRSAATTSTPAGLPGGGRLLPSAGGSVAGCAPPWMACSPDRRLPRAARRCVTEPVGPCPTPPAPAAHTERGRPGSAGAGRDGRAPRAGETTWGTEAGTDRRGRRCTGGPRGDLPRPGGPTRGVRSGDRSPPTGAAAGSLRWGRPGRRSLPTRRTRCAPGTNAEALSPPVNADRPRTCRSGAGPAGAGLEERVLVRAGGVAGGQRGGDGRVQVLRPGGGDGGLDRPRPTHRAAHIGQRVAR